MLLVNFSLPDPGSHFTGPADDGSVFTAVAEMAMSPAHLFSKDDAEAILGQPVELMDSLTSAGNGVVAFNCTYRALVPDHGTGKTGAVYFMIEEFQIAEQAASAYTSIKKSNEGHEGIKILANLGDGAYFHSDGENFYFILVRKGAGLFRMKVNKLTSVTSLDGFHRIAQKIAKEI